MCVCEGGRERRVAYVLPETVSDRWQETRSSVKRPAVAGIRQDDMWAAESTPTTLCVSRSKLTGIRCIRCIIQTLSL